jgi:hypothetical protein
MKSSLALDDANESQRCQDSSEAGSHAIEESSKAGRTLHGVTAVAPISWPQIDGAADLTAPIDPSPKSALIPTVFHEDWWLEAATQGRYSVAEVSANGKTVGRLPFLKSRRLGIRGIWTPPLTYFLGPAVDEGTGSPNTRFLRRLEITRSLIQQLPRSSWECVRCHRGITDVIPFQEQQFRTYAQFTHEVAVRPPADLWKQMRDKTRNVIRRASERFDVFEISDPDEFISLYERNLREKKVQNTMDLAACRRVLIAVLEHGSGRMIAARNAEDGTVAANFCAWDSEASYYIACTRNSASGNGATSLLLWEAMQHAAKNSRIFDFAGLGTSGSVLHYAGFGATIATRFIAVRANAVGLAMNAVRSVFTEDHFFF